MKFIFDDKEIGERYKALPESVQKLISRYVFFDISNCLYDIDKCESPIEQLLGIALIKQFEKVLPYVADDYFIIPQEEIAIKGKTYRLDFSIFARKGSKYCSLAVECDGHDYHEKTKQQAQRGKKRDRDLQLAGLSVIRFTGSEIYADPVECAREAMKIVLNTINES